MLQTAILLLAAGNSSRLGRAKQLVPFGRNTLLKHAAQTALGAELGPVTVVLGADEDRCRETLGVLPLTIISNPKWEDGMGGSIAAGMEPIDESAYRAVIVMLCDQPAITTEVLRSLAMLQRLSDKPIVASEYDGTLGAPAIFGASEYPALRRLEGHQGAKPLFNDPSKLTTLPCPEGAVDIDTEKDLETLEERIRRATPAYIAGRKWTAQSGPASRGEIREPSLRPV